MTDAPSGGLAIERRSPDAVFALLGDDTRIDIPQALGETPDAARSFSDLRERVGVADSGQFDHHLQNFVGIVDAGAATSDVRRESID
jgi:hypothetical protein